MRSCCQNLTNFLQLIKENQETKFQKEEETVVNLVQYNKKNVLAIEHPLHEIPGLVFNFCPYCGRKQPKFIS